MSQEPNDIPPADRELEAALRSLRPAGTALPLSDALFEAGRRSASHFATRQLWVWRGLACLMAVALAAAALRRSEPAVVERERLVYVPAASGSDDSDSVPANGESTPSRPLRSESMLTLRQVALERGIEHLPSPRGGHLQMMRASDAATP